MERNTSKRTEGRRWLVFVPLLAATAALATGIQSPLEKAEARLDKTSTPASGKNESTLLVSGFGRYAVTVKSAQGTALQLVDHMSGPGEVSGATGETDGRLDMFLDRGAYKIRTFSPDKGQGNATLEAHAFLEQNGPQPPLLVELKNVSTSLGDFEQRSWWLQIDKRRPVALEAAGRHLADLRLWKDGTWLVDLAPETEVIEPKSGQPLQACRFSTTLDPGLYLLSAYGGPSQPWAQESDEKPLYLRYGVPTLPSAGRRRLTMSPFGVDRYSVSNKVNYYRLELPEARPASIQVASGTEPFQRVGASSEIRKDSALPVAEVSSRGQLVTVRGEAGQPYLLQSFELRDYYPFDGTGQYWLSTVHSGHSADSIDATAVLVRSEKDARFTPLQTQAIEISPFEVWARRFNALDVVTLFLNVKKTGTYGVLAQGPEAQFRIEPFMVTTPDKYKPPAFKSSGSGWDLDPGLYVLTIQPVEKGVLALAIYPARMLSVAKTKLASPEELSKASLQAAARFGAVTLEAKRSYALYYNRQPEVRTGLVLRKLPLDLTDALPLALKPGESVSVPFSAGEDGTLRAETEDASKLDVALDGGAPQASVKVAAGKHDATVRNGGSETLIASLVLEPRRLQADTPLPPLPEAALESLPRFGVMTESTPQFADLPESGSATFIVRADEPALYQLQSTGLLATEGNLRTRTTPSLFRQSENGVGRNFLVQQYLREGMYQITVTAQGSTYGHLGVELRRTRLKDGGELSEEVPARVELSPGDAVAYRFRIREAGQYRLQSFGLGRTFHCRLEDDAGWPVAEPDLEADLTRDFEPGTYRLILLPESVTSRRVTLLQRVPPELKFEGHGPHSLPLARRVEHRWLEPAEGAARTPDAWEFEMPAPATVTIELSGEMEGKLVRVGGAAGDVAAVPAGKGWQGRLEAGRYRLETVCARINNKVDYAVQVRLDELLAGQSLSVTAPASVPLSVGRDGLTELASFGPADVRARLYDEAGTLLGENDDRPEDWNFLLLQRLAPGRYRLQIDPVGTSSASCTVAMRAPEEKVESALALPAKTEVVLGQEVRLFPLELPPDAKLLVLAVSSVETVGCTLEASYDGGWKTVTSALGHTPRIEMPLSGGGAGRYRLRLWSLDRRGTAVEVRAAAASPSMLSEAALSQGASPEKVAGIEPPLGVLAVKLDRPGVFQLQGAALGLRWSGAVDVACQPAGRGLAAGRDMLWLVGELPAGGTPLQVQAARLVLGPGQAPSAPLPLPRGAPAVWDLAAPGQGPVLAVATAMIGAPGVRVADGADALGPPSGRAMAAAPRSAVSVALRAEQPAAVLWPAEDTSEPMEVRLQTFSFSAPTPTRAAWGVLDGTLHGVEAASFDLPAGPKRLRLTLGGASVGVLGEGTTVQSVHWSAGRPFEETVETSAPRLTLLHSAAGDERYSLEVLPVDASERAATLGGQETYEKSLLRAGTLRIAVQAAGTGPGLQLHARGSARGAVFVGADGRVEEGLDLPLNGAGTLLLRHDPGLVLAWMDRPGQEGQALWGQSQVVKSTDVSVPATVPLSGTVQALRFTPTHPAMLHLRAGTPAVTLVRRGQAAPEVEAHLHGCSLDTYVASGPVEIVLRALNGPALSGTAELTATELTAIDEGLGPEVILPAGATRAFSFTVTRSGPVGIGVHADAGEVECWLLDGSGKRLGSGVVQMPDLAPGPYLLALHIPENAGPVRVRPALAGIKPPDTGPPAEVIQKYLRIARGEPEQEPTPAAGSEPSEGQEEHGEPTQEQQENQQDAGDQGEGVEP
jgi:hypothetical protein